MHVVALGRRTLGVLHMWACSSGGCRPEDSVTHAGDTSEAIIPHKQAESEQVVYAQRISITRHKQQPGISTAL